jgi:hypothetical protein
MRSTLSRQVATCRVLSLIHLTKIDPAKIMRRFYAIDLQPTLAGYGISANLTREGWHHHCRNYVPPRMGKARPRRALTLRLPLSCIFRRQTGAKTIHVDDHSDMGARSNFLYLVSRGDCELDPAAVSFCDHAQCDPGVGPALATALVARVADPKAFRSGRDFSAWVGLVPEQNSSDGRNRLGNITKAGDRYLRSLFCAGGLAVIKYAQ